jgi:Squalene-hopene cyclase C-terminal domain
MVGEGYPGRPMRELTVLRANLGLLGAKLAGSFWPPNAAVVARNAAAAARAAPWENYAERKARSVDDAASAGLDWICRSQDWIGSGGVGSYEFFGFTTGYPEVTGYIIPTMWDYRTLLGREDLGERAVRMADWELRIQHREGGWEGGNEGDGEPPVVFNTGQVIRGLLRTYEETSEEKYLDAAVRAADWIVSNQDADGSWTRSNYRQLRRVYDAYVSAPLARLASVTGEGSYSEAALRNCEFVLAHQRENGWFELCDNSPHFNDRPSTHTLCYTSDGLIETGSILDEDTLVAAGRRTALALAGRVDETGLLPGRFDEDWQPRVSWVCLTGAAQLGIILSRLGEHPDVSRRLLDFLLFAQDLNAVGKKRVGALTGSFPVWGAYAPFKYPCWATKYLLDFLLAFKRAQHHPPAEVRVAGH